MPLPRPCWPALSLMLLWEVGYPPYQAGLASWKDWHGSCLCSGLIPSVTERSALFVKELSFPQTVPTDDAFFNWNWPGPCLDRLARARTAGRSDAALSCKNK